MTKRKALTRVQLIQLMLDQEGKCGCGCGVKLDPRGEGVIDEHLIPRELSEPGHQGERDDLSNRRLFRKPCASKKTTGTDIPQINKAKRQGLERGQQARLARRGKGLIPARINAWPAKGSVKIQSRGFERKKT